MPHTTNKISVTVDGKTYAGTYEVSGSGGHVSGGTVTVVTGSGRKSAETDGMPVEGVAAMLLEQLVREGNA